MRTLCNNCQYDDAVQCHTALLKMSLEGSLSFTLPLQHCWDFIMRIYLYCFYMSVLKAKWEMKNNYRLLSEEYTCVGILCSLSSHSRLACLGTVPQEQHKDSTHVWRGSGHTAGTGCWLERQATSGFGWKCWLIHRVFFLVFRRYSFESVLYWPLSTRLEASTKPTYS